MQRRPLTPQNDTDWLALACTNCRDQLLENKSGMLACPQCGRNWPVTNGVPQFVSDFPYWGEIPQQSIAEVNRQAAICWKSALTESREPDVQRASEMILNLARANWCLLTSLPRESRVLDIGAGMGTTAHALALRYREVVATEPVEERIEFMRHRFAQEELKNIRLVRTSLWDLPFPKASFDLVAMNGVLEWVPVGRRGNPRQLQRAALENVIKLLRPGGILYVGIENRYSAGYFVGYRDPHCGLPWVTILPRMFAHLYMKRHGQPQGYRNYLYSARGYQKLLLESGFRAAECYLALPSYNHPKFYIPLRDNTFSYFSRTFVQHEAGLKRFAQQCALRIGLLKHLQYSFALFATK